MFSTLFQLTRRTPRVGLEIVDVDGVHVVVVVVVVVAADDVEPVVVGNVHEAEVRQGNRETRKNLPRFRTSSQVELVTAGLCP